MINRNISTIFTIHIIKEFLKSLAIFIILFLSLIILTNYIEELFFLKEMKFLNSMYSFAFLFTLIKTPSMLLNLLPFIFLFSSTHFFFKIIHNNEFLSLKISGISNLFLILIPSLFSFFLGIVIVLIFSPISSELTKYYENQKRLITGTQNLIILNDNGIWVKEEKNNQIIILRSDNFLFNNNKNEFKNLTFHLINVDGNLVQLINAKNAYIDNDYFNLENVEIYENDAKKTKKEKLKVFTSIKIDSLKNLFQNVDVFSIWNISGQLKTLKSRGYDGDEILIKLHKYISLPFMLFSIVIFATIFTVNSNRKYQNYTYAFFSIILGIILYFLTDFSIALGKSNRIPIVMSVWAPIVLILILSLYSLLRSNEN